jgi:hypothetical protein
MWVYGKLELLLPVDFNWILVIFLWLKLPIKMGSSYQINHNIVTFL